MEKTIWFDMDGTIANFYGVENWLAYLERYDTTPYKVAKPLINMQVLARELNRLQKQGYKLGIVSWLSKTGTEEYGMKVTKVKKQWLNKHLKSVKFDYIHIINYGSPKQKNRNGILFDDEKGNRDNWNDIAYDEKHILEVLKKL